MGSVNCSFTVHTLWFVIAWGPVPFALREERDWQTLCSTLDCDDIGNCGGRHDTYSKTRRGGGEVSGVQDMLIVYCIGCASICFFLSLISPISLLQQSRSLSQVDVFHGRCKWRFNFKQFEWVATIVQCVWVVIELLPDTFLSSKRGGSPD